MIGFLGYHQLWHYGEEFSIHYPVTVNTKYTFNDADEVQIPITDRDRNVLNSLFF